MNKRKWLIRLNQKVIGMGDTIQCFVHAVHRSLGLEWMPKVTDFSPRNVETSYCSQKWVRLL